MKRIAVEKLCGWSVMIVISVSAAAAEGQFYENHAAPPNSAGIVRQPLNQLPPIVSPAQMGAGSNMLQPIGSLHLPPIVRSNSQNRQQTGPGSTGQTLAPPAQPGQHSKSGVSLYPSTRQSVQTFNPPPQGSTFGRASFHQGSGSRLEPPIGTPGNFSAPSMPVQDFPNSMVPGNLPGIPEIEMDAAPMVAPNGSVNTPGANDYFENQQSITNNSGYPIGDANAGCSSCGSDGCYDLATVQNQFGCCGSVVSAGYYMFLEGLVWTRTDGDVQLSNFFGLNDFGTDGGLRLTLGYRQNATRGREFTYFGIGELNESRTVNRPTGGLGSRFIGADGFGFAQTSSFFNAVTQTQSKSSQLQSLAFNRVNWSWDLLKTYIGARYIYFDDNYSYFSSNGFTNGLFTMDSVNNLFGINGGLELFYDVGYRTALSFDARVGGYVNAANVDTNLFNGGVQQLSQDVDDSSFASTVELELMTHIKLGPRSRFRVGYDLFLLWGAFTIENNVPRDEFRRGVQVSTPVITPTTGSRLNTNNEPVFLNGLVFGFEVFR